MASAMRATERTSVRDGIGAQSSWSSIGVALEWELVVGDDLVGLERLAAAAAGAGDVERVEGDRVGPAAAGAEFDGVVGAVGDGGAAGEDVGERSWTGRAVLRG